MERHIAAWSYWLGVTCAVLALLWRALNTLGLRLTEIPVRVFAIAPMTLFKGAVLLLLTGVATANYVWLKRQMP